jgi:transcriptional regulator with XRE-family HTH domain
MGSFDLSETLSQVKGGVSLSIDIGNHLREKRESLGLSIEQLEMEAGIPKEDIVSLEKGQFGLLPNQMYVRSYLRAYAKAVGESPQTILMQYARSMPQNLRRSAQPHERSRLPYAKNDVTMNQREPAATVPRRYHSHYDAGGKKVKSSFEKFYDWLLIIGALTLMMATVAYVWYTRS